jgi:Ca-activated chloride channel family protein
MTMAAFRRAGAAALAWLAFCTTSPLRVTAGGPHVQAPPSQAATTFRSSVDLIALNVTVTDPSNRYLTDLTADDFLVYEDSVKQNIGYFSRTSLSLSVSLLLDSSASMEDKMRTTQEAALVFVQSLRPEDQAQVIDFDSRVNVLAPFTSSKADLGKAIASTVPGGSTSLYTAMYIALRELKKTEARGAEDLRRRAVIVLSDGEDTSSLVSYDEVLEAAKRSETAIYAIGIRSKDTTAGGKGYGQADFALRQLTSQTGGRVFFPTTVDELKPIYALISQELSSQYLVGYTSSNPKRDGAWRRINVRTTRSGATARTRMGYYAPGG